MERVAKMKGDYSIDNGKNKYSVDMVKEILEIQNSSSLSLCFEAQDANLLLEISDYLK